MDMERRGKRTHDLDVDRQQDQGQRPFVRRCASSGARDPALRRGCEVLGQRTGPLRAIQHQSGPTQRSSGSAAAPTLQLGAPGQPPPRWLRGSTPTPRDLTPTVYDSCFKTAARSLAGSVGRRARSAVGLVKSALSSAHPRFHYRRHVGTLVAFPSMSGTPAFLVLFDQPEAPVRACGAGVVGLVDSPQPTRPAHMSHCCDDSPEPS